MNILKCKMLNFQWVLFTELRIPGQNNQGFGPNNNNPGFGPNNNNPGFGPNNNNPGFGPNNNNPGFGPNNNNPGFGPNNNIPNRNLCQGIICQNPTQTCNPVTGVCGTSFYSILNNPNVFLSIFSLIFFSFRTTRDLCQRFLFARLSM